jgi:hypothetical protein
MANALTFDQFTAAVKKASVRVSVMADTLRVVAGDLVETNLTVGGAYSPGTPVDTGEALSGWERVRRGSVETFTNSTPYIRPLEYGHSQQAPQGFVRLTALHWPEIVRDAKAIVARGQARAGMFA